MHNRIYLGGEIAVDNINMKSVIEFINKSLDDKSRNMPRVIIAQNATKAAICLHNKQFKKLMNEADLLIPDGSALLFAAKVLDQKIVSRVTGIDVMDMILEIANEQNKNIFFLGARENVCNKLKENIIQKFPNLVVSGAQNGYFTLREGPKILELINNARPDILFVALGSPKQEKWILTNRKNIRSKLCIGVGGSFDIYAGIKNRAPDKFRNWGLEGVYRILNEPRRILRLKPYITLFYFTFVSWIKKYIKYEQKI